MEAEEGVPSPEGGGCSDHQSAKERVTSYGKLQDIKTSQRYQSKLLCVLKLSSKGFWAVSIEPDRRRPNENCRRWGRRIFFRYLMFSNKTVVLSEYLVIEIYHSCKTQLCPVPKKAPRATQVMADFQQCSYRITTLAYQTVLELTTHTEISEMLCQALANISATCPNLLQECFAAEDVDQMRSLHLQEMKEFLLRIVKGRVSAEQLEGCISDILKESERKPDVAEVSAEVTNSGSRASDFNTDMSDRPGISMSTVGRQEVQMDDFSRQPEHEEEYTFSPLDDSAEDFTWSPPVQDDDSPMETASSHTTDLNEYYDLTESSLPDEEEEAMLISDGVAVIGNDDSLPIDDDLHHGILLDLQPAEEPEEEDSVSQVVRSVQDYQIFDEDSNSNSNSNIIDNEMNDDQQLDSVLASGTSALQGGEKYQVPSNSPDIKSVPASLLICHFLVVLTLN